MHAITSYEVAGLNWKGVRECEERETYVRPVVLLGYSLEWRRSY